MKHLFLFLVTGILISCANNETQTPAGTQTVAAEKETTIEWIDSTHRDLGQVNKGQIVEVAWRFKNAGSVPLVFSQVTAGCGCTVAEKPEEPVAPGKEGIIRASYDSKGQPLGENSKSVTVQANTRGTPSHYLTFRLELTEK